MSEAPKTVEVLDEDNSHFVDCWQCGGYGFLAGCFEDCCSGADCDPDDPENCCCPSRCDICRGNDGYRVPFTKEPT